VFGFLPEQFMVFHWHGDTFRLPPEALPLARSAGCENQAFLYHGRVLALQFHLEVTAASVRQMVQHGDNEMVPDKYVQSAADVLAAPSDRFQRMNNAMFGILDRLPK
jgi:GMP synthase-like glutamine amidotransferase